jgi:hypothetical protein
MGFNQQNMGKHPLANERVILPKHLQMFFPYRFVITGH